MSFQPPSKGLTVLLLGLAVLLMNVALYETQATVVSDWGWCEEATDESPLVCLRQWVNAGGNIFTVFAAGAAAIFALRQVRIARAQANYAALPILDARMRDIQKISGCIVDFLSIHRLIEQHNEVLLRDIHCVDRETANGTVMFLDAALTNQQELVDAQRSISDRRVFRATIQTANAVNNCGIAAWHLRALLRPFADGAVQAYNMRERRRLIGDLNQAVALARESIQQEQPQLISMANHLEAIRESIIPFPKG